MVFLKLSTCYLLFIIKMCFYFFDQKQKIRSHLTIILKCFVINSTKNISEKKFW